MLSPPDTPFARFLMQGKPVTVPELAACWRDRTVTFRLPGLTALPRPELGGHLRRSFLGALAAGASDQARRGRPCPWDPPCALDIFMREQFRTKRGEGLPKPWVLFAETEGDDLLVSLRVFGHATSWFPVAAEAMLAGMRDILPWKRLYGRSMPAVTTRRFAATDGIATDKNGRVQGIEFLTPVDVSGLRGAVGRSVLSRMLRRVNGLAKWHGLMLAPEVTRALTGQLDTLSIDESGLRPGQHDSPNRKAQRRRHRTMSGRLRLAGELSAILPLLALGERCHVGRAAVEGLGRFRVLRQDTDTRS